MTNEADKPSEEAYALLALTIKHGDFRFAHGQCHARGEAIEAELNFDYAQGALRELRERLASEAAPAAPPMAWIRSDHLQKALHAPFLCAVQREEAAGYSPVFGAAQPATPLREVLSDERIFALAKLHRTEGKHGHDLIWETDPRYAGACDMPKDARWSQSNVRAESTLAFARSLLAASSDEDRNLLEQAAEALETAHTFIRDGVEFGYIKDTTNPDWRGTLGKTRIAIAALRSRLDGEKT